MDLFEKRLYHAVAMSTICQSVRRSFPDFFSTFFEISISKLVYTFSTWHDMSSLSFIANRSCWPTFRQKYIKHIFCSHALINQDKSFKSGTHVALCVLLNIRSIHKKSYFWNFGDYFGAFWNIWSFLGFFSCFEISIWNLVYTSSSQRHTAWLGFMAIGTLWPTL